MSAVYVIVFLSLTCLVAGDTGILFAENETGAVIKSCIAYNPKFKTISTLLNESVVYPLKDFSDRTGCDDIHVNESFALKGSVVALKRGNCTFVEKAEFVQKYGAVGVLIIIHESLFTPGPNQTSDFQKINITVSLIESDNYHEIQKLGKHIKVGMYQPELDKFDPAIVLIFSIGMLCIIVGGYWSGTSKYERYCAPKKKRMKRKSKKSKKDRQKDDSDDEEDDDDNDTLDLKPLHIIIFVVIICGMLLALYFLYDYLVYVVIGLFALAGAMGLFSCVQPVWAKVFPCQFSVPTKKVPCCSDNIELRYLCLFFLSIAIGVFWVVQRHASYAWIIQDILGLAFCINMLKTVKLASLKVCTVLLILLFFYDIFFVFITPLFTKNGDSIMVQVATGGSSKTNEQLPMVFKVPKLQRSDLTLCDISYSLLGFGDIIVPGLLISYNYGFDLRVQSRRIYFISTVIAYAVGLIITFIALFFMESGQPALLYLVPCTLITTFSIAWYRKELKHIWTGDLYASKEKVETKTTNSSKSERTVTSPPTEPDAIQVDVSSSSSVSTLGNEDRQLLNR